MNTFEGIRYPIDSAEINKHQIGFSLSSDEGMLSGHNLSNYLSRAELEEISEGLIRVYASQHKTRLFNLLTSSILLLNF